MLSLTAQTECDMCTMYYLLFHIFFHSPFNLIAIVNYHPRHRNLSAQRSEKDNSGKKTKKLFLVRVPFYIFIGIHMLAPVFQ